MKLIVSVKVYDRNSYHADADREIEVVADRDFLLTATQHLAGQIVKMTRDCIDEVSQEEEHAE